MYLDNLIPFLKKENPDIVVIEEVSCGQVNLYVDKRVCIFDVLKEALGYEGVFSNDQQIISSTGDGMGTAVLTRHKIEDSTVVGLKKYKDLDLAGFDDRRNWEHTSRNLLDVSINFEGNIIHALPLHGAWTAPPVDTAETMRQATEVADHLKNLSSPFLFGVDMNNVMDSKTALIIEAVAKNLVRGANIQRTTHPTLHKTVRDIPHGLLIDFIYASNEFTLKSIETPLVDISDHLPVVAELEFTLSS